MKWMTAPYLEKHGSLTIDCSPTKLPNGRFAPVFRVLKDGTEIHGLVADVEPAMFSSAEEAAGHALVEGRRWIKRYFLEDRRG